MKTHRDPSAKNGFALVVTISLMILLTIIAVGLLGLSAVALRSSSQGESAAVARANARMALIIAVGELQRELGPDSRISAPHDAGTTAGGGQPHWTAVYDAWRRPDDQVSPETPQSRNPRFRAWLVSGQSGATSEKALLVGPGSLGKNARPEDEIRVPMQAVSVGSQQGRIAWWASDDGVKAKVNAGSDDDLATDPLFAAQSAPHVGHQAIETLGNLVWKTGQRSVCVSNGSLDLAANLDSSGIGNLSHSVTVHSAGVICDVREGRLKRDLSNLLSYPIEELQDKPLYTSNGRMNRFVISEAGTIANGQGIGNNGRDVLNSPNEWGINLEELHLFQNLHRELEWTGNQPRLTMRSKRETVINDRYYLYKRPVIDAVQFIISLKAVPHQGKYRMLAMLDGMVSLSNPNDIPIQWPAGLIFPVQLQNIPYDLKWNIQTAGGATKNSNTASSTNFGIFIGRIGGGANQTASGFTLEPGEAAVFGSTTGKGVNLDLMRGFKPSGGVEINATAGGGGWDLKATGLDPTDRVDFTLTKGGVGYQGNYTYYNAWVGDRKGGNPQMGWQIDSCNLGSTGDLNSPRMNQMLVSPIRPPEVLRVSDYFSPRAILLISFLRNVEQPSTLNPPDATNSRAFQLAESAGGWTSLSPSTIETALHSQQRLITAEPLNFQFRTLAAGDGGKYAYQGGGRQPNLGGKFHVIRRRIPLAPPLSLGAFENAIACGYSERFKDQSSVPGDPLPANAMALNGDEAGFPEISKAIGNSHGTPFLKMDQVHGTYSPSANSASKKTATDPSWMVNTALWDSWFLSGIVDGQGKGSNAFQTDMRSPRDQFMDLAKSTGAMRNTRYLFHSHRSPDEAAKELFNDGMLRKSALNSLAKYLLIDGAFNVNSTSIDAWEAMLSSVRDQELMVGGGGKKTFNHPYGTIGYAQNDSPNDDWTGLRDLTDSEIETLAGEIVTEVRSRGPFLSLADFVNRRPNSSDSYQQAIGALQAAIDRSGLNNRFTGPGRSVVPDDFGPLPGGALAGSEPAPARALGSAGHLTQAKLLTAIGSQITVRSDTFTVRTYGDARDTTGKILATAWCEATVQRLPEYVDATDRPEDCEGWPQPTDKLSDVNSRFGRRWEIKTFRWLASGEVLGS